MMKCRRNVNFEKMDTEPSRRKNDGFWLLWVIFKQYLKQNIITAVLKKSKFSFRCHLQTDKKNQ